MAPDPVSDEKSFASNVGRPRPLARRRIAFATGCWLNRSTAATTERRHSSFETGAGKAGSNVSTSVTSGCPRVTVPVLSRATTRIRDNCSRWIPPLIKMPRRAAVPSVATLVMGIESTRAQGAAATMKTVARVIEVDQETSKTRGVRNAKATPVRRTAGLYRLPNRSMNRGGSREDEPPQDRSTNGVEGHRGS